MLFLHSVRTQAIKFLESLVLLQTYTEADSVVRDGEFNLDQVPLTLKVARPRKLEEEARYESHTFFVFYFLYFFLYIYSYDFYVFV